MTTKWLTQAAIADMFNLPLSTLYPKIIALRKAGVIEVKPNPDDDKLFLISSKSLDIIRVAIRTDRNRGVSI